MKLKLSPPRVFWNLKDKRVETGTTVNSWACVVLGRATESEVRAFLQELVVTCQDTGVNFSSAARNPPIVNGSTNGVDAVCTKPLKRLNKPSRPRSILVGHVAFS